MKPRIFKIEGNRVSLDREEIGLYPAFNTILRRDRGSENDADGRKKYHASKELHYIYLVADYQSPLVKKALNTKELNKEAKIQANLSDNWKPDKDIAKAIEFYKEQQYDLREEHIQNLIDLFKSQLDRVKMLKKDINRYKEVESITEESIKIWIEKEKELFTIAAEAPRMIQQLNSALKDVSKMDNNADTVLRGGKQKRDSQDPSTSL